MDRFLERFSLTEPGRNRNYEQPNYKHWNWSCDQKTPKKQKPRTRWLYRRILSNIQRRANAYPSKTLSKITEEGTLPNSFYEATITLITKPDKDNTQKRKLQANITDEHRCKNPQQNFSKQDSAIQLTYHDQVGFIPGMQGFFNICKTINVIYHINNWR